MRDIYSIKRPLDIPEEVFYLCSDLRRRGFYCPVALIQGLLNDLLWADPGDIDSMWAESDRGVSVLFGKKAVSKFLSTHNFELVARGHMVVEDGYEFFGYDARGCSFHTRKITQLAIAQRPTTRHPVFCAKLLWRIRQCCGGNECIRRHDMLL